MAAWEGRVDDRDPLDRRGLARRLQPLGQHQRGAFAASCAQRAFDTAAFLDRQLAPVPEEDSLEDLRALIEHGIPLPDPPSARFSHESCSDNGTTWQRSTLLSRRLGEALLAQMRHASAAYATDFLAALEAVFDAR